MADCFPRAPGGVADATMLALFWRNWRAGAQATFQPSKLIAGAAINQRIELAGNRRVAGLRRPSRTMMRTWEGRLYAGGQAPYGLRPVRLPKELIADLKTPEERASPR